MRWREPLYAGDRVRKHLEEYRQLLRETDILPAGMKDFYLIVSPANEKNLMELIPVSCLRGVRYRADRMRILGVAADRWEACALCEKMLGDCYRSCGTLDRDAVREWLQREARETRETQEPAEE